MNDHILELMPQNLPVYVYKLDASAVLVHKDIGYLVKKGRGYFSSSMAIATNQPIRVGDFVDGSCCYYGNNSKIGIIEQLCWDQNLGKIGKELRYYLGCRIDALSISFVNSNFETNRYCGRGEGTVFIHLSAGSLQDRINELENKEAKEMSLTQQEESILDSLRMQCLATDNLDYWKTFVPNWDDHFELINELPKFFLY